MSERLAYSIDEAASMLGVSRKFVAALVKSGALHALRPGARKVLIPAASLDAFLAGGRTSEPAREEIRFG